MQNRHGILLLLAFVSIQAFGMDRPDKAKVRTTCEQALLSPSYFKRGGEIKTPDWHDDLAILRADMEMQAFNSVRAFFSRRWDTQVYYTATGIPSRQLEVPLVDPDCKAVVLFFHGSGTSKSGGANFVMNMSSLSNLQYCGISVDLPHHASGPISSNFDSIDEFQLWIKKIVDDISAFGKPVYLAGHSFGPEVIFEFLSRYPTAVAGALAISPAAFDDVTQDWYQTHTMKMKFGGDVADNEVGGAWADAISHQRTWKDRVDPTLANDQLKLFILSGNLEEYVPSPVGGPNRTPTGPNTYDISEPLQRYFANAHITIEQGIGHYLFDFRDSSGVQVVLRDFLLMMGGDPTSVPAQINHTGAQRNSLPDYLKVVQKFGVDLLFRSWVLEFKNKAMISALYRRQDNRWAQAILSEWSDARAKRFNELVAHIAETEHTDPEFYLENREIIAESLRKRQAPSELLSGYYKRNLGPALGIQ